LVVFGLLNPPSATTVVNAASLQPGAVAPGSLITIFGSNLANGAMAAPTSRLPRSLGGVTLSINGIAAPLLFVSPGQINAQVPFEVTEGPAKVNLQLAGMPPVLIPLTIAAAAPGLFPNIQDTPDHPASAGSVVTVYLTGQGAVTPSVSTGEAAPGAAVFPVTATVGNRQATITFAGLSPDSAGLFQIRLIVPRVAAGSHPLVITVNGVASNSRSLNVSGSRSRMAVVGH
jgi:uncharacterized protein (TIGR03437 family)